MMSVIATGYSGSGWEMALAFLECAGLGSADEELSQWHDAVLEAAPSAPESGPPQPLSPDRQMVLRLREIMDARSPKAPWSFADPRGLWLLDFWASEFPEARFLLFYQRIEKALASAIAQGRMPQEFVSGWQETNAYLMNFQRRHRRRALLLDADLACQHPHSVVSAGRQVGLEIDLADGVGETVAPVSVLERPVEWLLARQFLAEHTGLAAVEAELEATSTPLGEAAANGVPDSDTLIRSYRDLQARLSQLTRVRDEQAELVAALQKQRESLKAEKTNLSAARDEQSKLAAERQKQLDALSTEKMALLKDKASLSAARDQQLKLVAGHQQRLEALSEEKATLLKEKASLISARDEQARLAEERQAELVKARESNQALEAAGKETTKENELLLLQLHQVQEELETLFLQNQRREEQAKLDQEHRAERAADLQKQVETLTAEKASLVTEKAALSAARDEQARVAAERQKQLDALSTEKVALLKDKAALSAARDQQLKLAAGHQRRLEALNEEQATLLKEKASLISARDEQARLAEERQAELVKARESNQALEAVGKETTEENELLLLQLHQVQEELEIIFLQHQGLEPELEANQVAREQLKICLARTARARDAQARLAGERQTQLDDLQRLLQQQEVAILAAGQEKGDLESELRRVRAELDVQGRLAGERQTRLDDLQRLLQQQEAAILAAGQVKERLESELQRVRAELETAGTRLQEIANRPATAQPPPVSPSEDQLEGRLPGEAQCRDMEDAEGEPLGVGSDQEAPPGVQEEKETLPLALAHGGTRQADPFTGFFRRRRMKRSMLKDVRLLKESELFDEIWYLEQHPDVSAAGVDPVEHYLTQGAAEKRNPSPLFDTSYYLEVNQDVAQSGINPLIHYVRFGQSEGRRSVPVRSDQ